MKTGNYHPLGPDNIRSWYLEKSADPFIAADASDSIVDANEAAMSLFPVLRSLETGDPLPREIEPLFSDDGENIRILNKCFEKNILRSGEGFRCLSLIDRTERENLKEELLKAKSDAEETGMNRAALLSNMSHEIRTPMNAIVGISDILLREDLPSNTRGYLNNIKGSADALLTIINDILDISRIEDGSMKIAEEPYEIMSIMDDLAMIFLNEMEGKPVELLYYVDPGMPSKLLGDSRRIQQIIFNMVNNALYYTESGYISVSLTLEEKSDDYCVLSCSVEDSGNMQGEKNESSSLGFSICKQLIKLMGGEICLENNIEGNRRYFSLSQGIAEDKPAAAIKNKNEKYNLYYTFENEYLEISFLKLVNEFGFAGHKYEGKTDLRSMKDGGHACVFTDDLKLIDAAEAEKMADNGIEICLLQNPMKGITSISGCRIVNKPLYSLNFCQIINDDHNELRHAGCEMNFVAPDARILLVDDNEMNIQVALGLLAPLKMQIDSAANGRESIDCVRSNDYDIILMDHMMPVMDGVEALEHIYSMDDGRYSSIPIIALSANATSEAEEMFGEKGFSDFIAKPIKIRELLKCLKTWIPAEKIIYIAKEKDVRGLSSNAQDEEDTGDIPSEIEGLDVQKGIDYCGSPALFRKCIVIFYKIIDKKSNFIRKCLDDGLVRDLTIEVHALKNSARMIGAQELSDDFKELEQMGNEENLQGLMEKTPAVLELYRSYKEILRPFADSEKKDAYIPKPEEVIEKLEEIRSAMDAFDMDGADEAMGKLRDYSYPKGLDDRIMELDAMVSDFAMEDVMKLADELIRDCKNADTWK